MTVLLDSLPELSDEFKQQQQQAVLDAPILYEFELIKEELIDYIDLTIVGIGICMLFVFHCYLAQQAGWWVILFFIWGVPNRF